MSSNTSGSTSASALVLQRQQQFWSAVKQQDPALLKQVLAENFVCRSPGEADQSREEFISRITSIDAVVTALSSDGVLVEVLDEIAVLSGLQTAQLRLPNGSTVTQRLALTNIYRLIAGAWRMVSAHPVTVSQERTPDVRLRSAVPALLVDDVDMTAEWFVSRLGFEIAGIFPRRPPSVWASLQRDAAEIMLQRLSGYRKPNLYDQRPGGVWHAYIRTTGVHRLYDMVHGQPFVKTALRRQPYGDWEFEVEDPNGYLLVFGGDESVDDPR